MGTLIYGTTGLTIDLEDRVLAHLQIVIVAKLRRNEGFLFTWRDSHDSGSARSSVWMHASVPLQFLYDDAETPEINRSWLDVLSMSSHSAAGLRVVAEPPETPQGPRQLV